MYGASASDDTTFHISTNKPNQLLPYLLTVPVIKDGAASQTRPVSCGPYMYVEGADYVEAFAAYGEAMPVDRIYFKEYTEPESIITAFEDGYLDLTVNDTSSAANLGYGGNNEIRYYTTTNMHYIGVNMESEMLANPNLRYALALAVDREHARGTSWAAGPWPAACPSRR